MCSLGYFVTSCDPRLGKIILSALGAYSTSFVVLYRPYRSKTHRSLPQGVYSTHFKYRAGNKAGREGENRRDM